MKKNKYDFIMFGATSFVGQILCKYLISKYGIQGDVSWAAAEIPEAQNRPNKPLKKSV